MQDRYAADIGDFGKFLLLRYLFNHTGYKLKQIWYMYPDESHNNDGLYINYFDKIKNQDSILEETFKQISKTNRSVKALEEAQLLNNCSYFSQCINENGKDELAYRKQWLRRALEFVLKADYTFVDPDNGIATKLLKEGQKKDIKLLSFDGFNSKTKSGKYIFLDEIRAFYKISRCVLIYHHLNRTMSHNEQIKIIQRKLKDEFFSVLAIKHKPYSPRVYFFVLKDKYIEYFAKNNLQKFQEEFSKEWEFFE